MKSQATVATQQPKKYFTQLKYNNAFRQLIIPKIDAKWSFQHCLNVTCLRYRIF